MRRTQTEEPLQTVLNFEDDIEELKIAKVWVPPPRDVFLKCSRILILLCVDIAPCDTNGIEYKQVPVVNTESIN